MFIEVALTIIAITLVLQFMVNLTNKRSPDVGQMVQLLTLLRSNQSPQMIPGATMKGPSFFTSEDGKYTATTLEGLLQKIEAGESEDENVDLKKMFEDNISEDDLDDEDD